MTARRRRPGARALAAVAGWCVVAVVGPGPAGAGGLSPPSGTVGGTVVEAVGALPSTAPATAARPPEGPDAAGSAPPATASPVADRFALLSGGDVAAAARAAPVTASSAPVVPADTVGTATPTSAPARTDDRRPVGSVLRILIVGFLLAAAGLVVATWWYVRATRPIASRRTV